MEITNLYPGGFASNCYLITNDTDAVLIDCSTPLATVQDALAKQNAALRAVLCTHGHFDHLLTADEVRKAFGVPLYLHEQDAEMPADGHKNAFTTFFGYERTWLPAERTFAEGDLLTFGSLTLRVLHTPGHSKGSSCFLLENALFTGDTLFAPGFGRTDLYGGDFSALQRSLGRLYTLPEHLTVYPGHGNFALLKHLIDQ